MVRTIDKYFKPKNLVYFRIFFFFRQVREEDFRFSKIYRFSINTWKGVDFYVS